jgi:hypothetical protein
VKHLGRSPLVAYCRRPTSVLLICIIGGLLLVASAGSAAAASGKTAYTAKLLDDQSLQPYANIGSSVAVGNGIVVVGSDLEDVCHTQGCGTDVGGALVLNATTGAPIGSLTAPFTGYGVFGVSASIGEGDIVIGAPGETARGVSAAGAVYVYNATTLVRLAELVSPSPVYSEAFGFSSVIGDGLIVVGAPSEMIGGAVAVGQVFVYNATTFKHVVTLSLPTNVSIQDAEFGNSVAVGKGEIIVGAPGLGPYGNVYVFGSRSHKLLANLTDPLGSAGTDGAFGFSVATGNGLIGVGAPNDDSFCLPGRCDYPQNFTNGGQVYLFDSKNFSFVRNISSPFADGGGWFGWSIAMAPGTIVVGAPEEDTPSGAAYGGDVYVFSSSNGSLISPLKMPNGAIGGNYDDEGFGASVAAYKNWLAVGAPGGYYRGVGCGLAYDFRAK